MGVYYYFYNVTQSKVNDKSIPNYGTLMHVAKLDSFDEPVIIRIFQDVIQANDWNPMDVIRASADAPEYPLIYYENGALRFDPTDEDDALPQRYQIIVSNDPEEDSDE